jgi:hypothetical protein
MTASALIAAELDHGTPCATCRWYVILIRRLMSDARLTKRFAQAHRGHGPEIHQAIRNLASTRTSYRLHRKACREVRA